MSVRSTVPPLPLASSTVYSRADVSESLTIYFIRFSIRPSSSSIILLIVTESPEEYTPPPPPHPTSVQPGGPGRVLMILLSLSITLCPPKICFFFLYGMATEKNHRKKGIPE